MRRPTLIDSRRGDQQRNDARLVNRLGVKWFETRSVSSSRKTKSSGDPEALGLLRL